MLLLLAPSAHFAVAGGGAKGKLTLRFPHDHNYDVRNSKQATILSDFCSDMTLLPKKSLVWDSAVFGPAPWSGSSAQVWRSPRLSLEVAEVMEHIMIPGLALPLVTFATMLYNKGLCWMAMRGRSILDTVTGRSPTDFEVGYTCPQDTLKEACEKVVAEPSICVNLDPVDTRIGQKIPACDGGIADIIAEPLEAGVFAPVSTQHFPPDELLVPIASSPLDLIDPDGRGAPDICSQTIRIPVSKDQWANWSTEVGLYYCLSR